MRKSYKTKGKRSSNRNKKKHLKKKQVDNNLPIETTNNSDKSKPAPINNEKNVSVKDRSLTITEQRKQRAKDIREAQQSRRLKLQLENRGLDALIKEANKRGRLFEKHVSHEEKERELKANSTNFKSYYKDLKSVVEAADVVLEVLDARDPLGSRCTEIEEMVVSTGKKLVLVLNKIDLIPKSNLDSWLKYLRQELPTVAFKASTQSQNSNLSQSRVAAVHINESLQQSSKCVGASFLMKILGNYCRNNNIQTFIKVGVVGCPNVGKSSVINSLKRARSCNVGATAGVTKSVQEVSLDKHIKILDSPGVVFAKDGSSATLALRNAVKTETLKDVITPAEAIIQRADKDQLRSHYSVPDFSSSYEFLGLLAKASGKYKKGGVPHIEEAAKRLINDWNRGGIKYCTHPPEEYKPSAHLNSCFVSEMGKAFDISTLEEQMELDKDTNVSEINSKSSLSELDTEKLNQPTELLSDEEEMESDAKLQNDQKVTVAFDPKKSRKVKKIISEFNIEELQKNKMIKKKFKQMKRNRLKREKGNSTKDIEELENEIKELAREEILLKKEEDEFVKLNKEADTVADTIGCLNFN